MLELHSDRPHQDLGLGHYRNIIAIICDPDLKVILLFEDPSFLNYRAKSVSTEFAVFGLDRVSAQVSDLEGIELLIQETIDLIGLARFGLTEIKGPGVIERREYILDAARNLFGLFLHPIDTGPSMLRLYFLFSLEERVILLDDITILVHTSDEDPRKDPFFVHIGLVAVAYFIEPIKRTLGTTFSDHMEKFPPINLFIRLFHFDRSFPSMDPTITNPVFQNLSGLKRIMLDLSKAAAIRSL